MKSLGVLDILTQAWSPRQVGPVERLVGSIRSEYHDCVIDFSDRHLLCVMGECFRYDNGSATHLGQDNASPDVRPGGQPSAG